MTNEEKLSIYENLDGLKSHLSNMSYDFLEAKGFKEIPHCISGHTHDLFLEVINEILDEIVSCSVGLEKLSSGEVQEMTDKIYKLEKTDIISALTILDEYDDLAHSRMR